MVLAVVFLAALLSLGAVEPQSDLTLWLVPGDGGTLGNTQSQLLGRGEPAGAGQLSASPSDGESAVAHHVNDSSPWRDVGSPAAFEGGFEGELESLLIEITYVAEDCHGLGRLGYLYVPDVEVLIDDVEIDDLIAYASTRECEPFGLSHRVERFRYAAVLEAEAFNSGVHTVRVAPDSSDERYLDMLYGSVSAGSVLRINPECAEWDGWSLPNGAAPPIPSCSS